MNPNYFNSQCSKASILRFNAASRDNFLLSGGPWNKIRTNKQTLDSGIATIVWTWGPICFYISLEIKWKKGIEKKAIGWSPFKVPKNSFYGKQIRCGWILHKLIGLIYSKWDFWSSKSDILECSYRASINGGIKEEFLINLRELLTQGPRCDGWFSCKHVNFFEKVLTVLFVGWDA